MSRYPLLRVDLSKIEHNTRVITKLASKHGMSITGVTKGVCGEPRIARAMLEGGAGSIGDSRILNLRRLREGNIDSDLMLLRPPMLSEIPDVVRYADVSLNTELKTLSALSEEATERGIEHKVMVLVEMGELRDGVNPEELDGFMDRALDYEGISVVGLAMNLSCLTGVTPTKEKITEFDSIVRRVEDRFGLDFEVVSGGNSANVPLLLGEHPETMINNLRIGEAILLGVDAVMRRPVPGAFDDAFTVEAEAIEVREKPSVPKGLIGQNAFGETQEFEDHGKVRRAVLAIGRQDVAPEGLRPCDTTPRYVLSSSDHMVLCEISENVQVGDVLKFLPNYEALMRLFTSPYVAVEFVT